MVTTEREVFVHSRLDLETVAAIEAGFPFERYSSLVASLSLPATKVNKLLDFSERTLGRRRGQGRFSAAESDRIRRLERLWETACEIAGDAATARGWLTVSDERLDGRTPLELLKTEAGSRVVEAMLGRFETTILRRRRGLRIELVLTISK